MPPLNRLASTALVLVFASANASSVTFDWVTVGDLRNPPDTAVLIDPKTGDDTSGHGAVGYTFRISKYETTNEQYAEFLNAVAQSDPYSLFNENMANDPRGGIVRSGSPGNYTYSVKNGFSQRPVNWVSFWDVLRFVNWLHNGQGSGGTETGAYTLLKGLVAQNAVSRSLDATFFLPSENEWYKAAYYNAAGSNYFTFPAGSSVQTSCIDVGPNTANSANCQPGAGGLVDVGSYNASPSPYGTFDQGGNIWEWNDTVMPLAPNHALAPGVGGRGNRGGSYFNDVVYGLSSASRSATPPPDFEAFDQGFRVASREIGVETVVVTRYTGLYANGAIELSDNTVLWGTDSGGTGDIDLFTYNFDSGAVDPAVLNHDQILWHSIDGNRIAWQTPSSSTGNMTVFHSDLSIGVAEEVPIDLGSVPDQYSPMPISNRGFAWRQRLPFSKSSATFVDFSTGSITQVADQNAEDVRPKALSGSKLFYYQFIRSGSVDLSLWMWDADTDIPTRIDSSPPDASVSAGRSRDYVAYHSGQGGGDTRIGLWKQGMDVTLLADGTRPVQADSWSLSGEISYPPLVAWAEWDGTDYEIVIYDIWYDEFRQLTDNTYDDNYPKVSGDTVVWGYDDGNDTELRLWNRSSDQFIDLTNNFWDETDWVVAGGNVAWRGYDPLERVQALFAAKVTIPTPEPSSTLLLPAGILLLLVLRTSARPTVRQ